MTRRSFFLVTAPFAPFLVYTPLRVRHTGELVPGKGLYPVV